MSVTGNWNLIIKTPMGEQKMQVQLVADGESLSGTMQDANHPAAAIKEGTIHGNKLGWKFDVTKPIKATVTFSLQIDGDTLTGTGKPAFFPGTPVKGTRA